MAKKKFTLFKKKAHKPIDHKIGLSQLIWLGFNYTVSMGFTLTLSKTFAGDNGVGYHLFWLILLGAVVAGGAAWAFAKCAGVYSDKNGGAFEYSRRTFGQFSGWMVGFYQYVLIPITTPASILVAIAISFQGLYSPTMWGSEEMTRLYLNLISIGMYVILSLSVLLGTIVFKWATNITSVIKWIILVMVYISAIIIMVRTSGSNFELGKDAGHLNNKSFNETFSAFFYAYTGFETFSAVGENVRNPKKNMPKAIMAVLIIAVIFYMIGLTFVVGALGNAIPENPNNHIIQLAMGSGALILVAICLVAQNMNGFMQGAFYSGGMLQPLAEQKMIYSKIADVDKNGLAKKALFLNILLTIIFSFIWLVLPIIINDPGVDYTSLIGFNSIVMFIVYGYVISAALVLSIKKKTKSNLFVYGLWFGVLIFLFYQCVIYFIGWETNKWQIVTFLGVTTLAVIWYFAYIRPKHKKRLAKGEIKESKISDLPDWSNSEDFKELAESKKKTYQLKIKSLADGSADIITPRWILEKKLRKAIKNKKIKLDPKNLTKAEIVKKLSIYQPPKVAKPAES